MQAFSNNILVIKHSALGDFIQALGAFQAIRDFHPTAEITLLTTAPYVDLAKATGYFHEVWVDDRPKIWQLLKLAKLKNLLNSKKFDRVYDLQTSDRTRFYYKLFHHKPEWNGRVQGNVLYHDHPNPKLLHTLDRQISQLKVASIENVPAPHLPSVEPPARVAGKYALLMPGGAPHRPVKRWPAAHFLEVASFLNDNGITPVLIGTQADYEPIQYIKTHLSGVVDLRGETDFLDIAALAAKAKVAIGNDTGPMHICVVAGCPSIVLFSRASDPALCAPRGEKVTILQKPDLNTLSPQEVIDKVAPYI